jgi:hypothetical protein
LVWASGCIRPLTMTTAAVAASMGLDSIITMGSFMDMTAFTAGASTAVASTAGVVTVADSLEEKPGSLLNAKREGWQWIAAVNASFSLRRKFLASGVYLVCQTPPSEVYSGIALS